MRDVGGAQGGGQAEISAGQRLADADDVRADAGVVCGEQLAGAAEPGRDLVENQQHLVTTADVTQVAQIAGIVEAHAAGALHDGFDDHGRQLGRVLGE